jgi:hypothetical protein
MTKESLAELWVMQEELRHPIEDMLWHVLQGGGWTRQEIERHSANSEPIQIVEFEDGCRMIHDGHHRVMASFLTGRTLTPQEYIIVPMTYDRYRTPNFSIGFVTPFDPVTEVRIHDFMDFKKSVLHALAEGQMEVAYNLMQLKTFCRPRTIKTVAELAAKIRGGA